MGSMVMLISSPDCKVKSSGGTMPVPVRRKQPCGNELSRKRNSTSDSGCALELRERRLTREDCFAGALDEHLDFGRGWEHLFRDEDTGTERAAPVIDFGLRQVERVRALDVARTHVVADGVADDFSAAVDHEREFRFWHVPV